MNDTEHTGVEVKVSRIVLFRYLVRIWTGLSWLSGQIKTKAHPRLLVSVCSHSHLNRPYRPVTFTVKLYKNESLL
jgi:hypothetical protein